MNLVVLRNNRFDPSVSMPTRCTSAQLHRSGLILALPPDARLYSASKSRNATLSCLPAASRFNIILSAIRFPMNSRPISETFTLRLPAFTALSDVGKVIRATRPIYYCRARKVVSLRCIHGSSAILPSNRITSHQWPRPISATVNPMRRSIPTKNLLFDNPCFLTI